MGNEKTGFTLIETVIALGILAFLASLTLSVGLDTYRGDAFRHEEALIVTLLYKARADALSNTGEASHGVALHPTDYPRGYVVFEGATYEDRIRARDTIVDEGFSMSMGASSYEVVFAPLSGATHPRELTLIDAARNHTAVIAINHEGGIDW